MCKIYRYIRAQSSLKVCRIVAECDIKPNTLYFVNFSVLNSTENSFTELRLTVNGKIEGSQTSNESIDMSLNTITVGSEVASSSFKGLLTDLLVHKLPWCTPTQKEFHEKYWDYPNGERSLQLLYDNLVQEKIEEKYKNSGCPKPLLKEYKYDEQYKQTMQEKKNAKVVVETEEEIKAKTDKSKAAKLERDRKQKRIKTDVNNFVKEIKENYPDFFDYLQEFVKSRKWIFKSMNYFSPTIKKPGVPKLKFACIHQKLAQIKDLPCPYYGIEEEHFFKVLNTVKELKKNLQRVYLIKFAEITETLYKDKQLGNYIAYDKWLHYLCWAEDLKPEGWVEKVEENKDDEEEEDESSEEEEEVKKIDEQKDEIKDPPGVFRSNVFVGDKVGLKDKLKKNMHELNETAEEETGDIPKVYFDNRKLYSFELIHDDERVQSLAFNYIVRNDEKTAWADVMKEFEETFKEDKEAEKETTGKKDDKKDTKESKDKQDNKGKNLLYRMEQVKSFQDKLPEEEPVKKDDPANKDGSKVEDPNKAKRYKFPDPKFLQKHVFKILETKKLSFKSCDNKIFSIRVEYNDGKKYRMELQKNMSPEFIKKREIRMDEIRAAERKIKEQAEEHKRREAEKKAIAEKERRERKENKLPKEDPPKNPTQDSQEVLPTIEVPIMGELDKVKTYWYPGQDTKFGMGLINEEFHLIGNF
jgi:hypothetical protein